jgi:hypothetical protein
MKGKLPNGLIFLAMIGIISPLFAVFSIFISPRPLTNMIFFGYLLQGPSFQAYYLSTGLIEGILGVGLLYLRYWSYVGFIAITSWNALEILVNIYVTTDNKVLATGWQSLHQFRVANAIIVIFAIVQVVWMTRYHNKFQPPCNGTTANQPLEPIR